MMEERKEDEQMQTNAALAMAPSSQTGCSLSQLLDRLTQLLQRQMQPDTHADTPTSTSPPVTSWRTAALNYARKRLVAAGREEEMREFMKIIEGALAEGRSHSHSHSQPIKQSSAATVTANASVTPAVAPVATYSPTSSPSSTSSTQLAPPPSVPSSTTSTIASSPPSSALLFTVADVSCLAPRGKVQLELSMSHATLHQPNAPAKTLRFALSDVRCIYDLPDLNKRDWLVVVMMKAGRGLTVGKQTHQGVILKCVATEKLKPERVKIHENEQSVLGKQFRSIVSGGSLFRLALSSLLRAHPSLQSIPFITGESSIFQSHKSLPCVGCKHGVEDGALYLLRSGLLFIKPLVQVLVDEIDGITPARGASSTFDIKVGIEGKKKDEEFQMIDPKDEQAIGKYCSFLAHEQARIEREKKAAKRTAAAGTVTPAATPCSATNGMSRDTAIELNDEDTPVIHASSSTPAAAASSTAAVASSPAAASTSFVPSLPSSVTLPDDSLDVSNVLPVPRHARRARPPSFAGMDDGEEGEDEEEDARERKRRKKDHDDAAAASSSSAAASHSAADDEDGNDAASSADSDSDDESDAEWGESDVDDASSSDAASYDSSEDAQSIDSNEDDDDDDEGRSNRRRPSPEDIESDEVEAHDHDHDHEDEEMVS